MEKLTSIGKYEILNVIGRGSMGFVYLAQDTVIDRQVAINVSADDMSRDAVVLKQLYCDFHEIKNLDHPNILAVYDIGEQNGHFYVVMQFNEDFTCAEMIRVEQHLSLIQSVDIIRQVCSALGYAHRKGVVHGNVRPSNVMVRKGGNAQLKNFGISHLVFNRGMLVGDQYHLAPERWKGETYDGRSDIFATGVLFFHLLTGNWPIRGMSQSLSHRRRPLSDFLRNYPAVLDDILDRSLANDPADRYQSADEMAADLCSVIKTLKQDYSQ
jgi:serine/threonine protein kinase